MEYGDEEIQNKKTFDTSNWLSNKKWFIIKKLL